MVELIKIKEENGKKLVSARELHMGLEIGTRFDNWIKRMIEYGFEKNVDYSVMSIFGHNSNGGKQNKTDYVITVDMAKEISMIQRSELGKKFRQYFIDCEKQLMNGGFKLPGTFKEALLQLVEQVDKNEKLEEANQKLGTQVIQKEQIIGELQPKADYTDEILKSTGTVTVTQIAKDYGLSGQALNKKLNDLKVQYKQSGQWLLYSHLHGMGYTKSETHKLDNGNVKLNTKWTQKGRLYLNELLKKNGVYPVIEKDFESVV